MDDETPLGQHPLWPDLEAILSEHPRWGALVEQYDALDAAMAERAALTDDPAADLARRHQAAVIFMHYVIHSYIDWRDMEVSGRRALLSRLGLEIAQAELSWAMLDTNVTYALAKEVQRAIMEASRDDAGTRSDAPAETGE